jgi:hypothetical protein
MDLFNKTFFRLAFGFVGIILFSVALIFIANAFTADGALRPCTTDCGQQ